MRVLQNTVWTIKAVIGESRNLISEQPIINLNVTNNQTRETHLMAVAYYGNNVVMAKITDGPAYYYITPVSGGGSRRGRKMKRRTMRKMKKMN